MLSASTLLPESASLFDMGVLLNNSAVSTAPAASNSAAPLAGTIGMIPSPPPPQPQQALAAGAAVVPPPYDLGQTFLLHSLPGATKTIYLDFTGFVTQNTLWNQETGLPNIVSPAYSLDTDYENFSDAEQTEIQFMWQRVAEDYRPFDVDVTTQDPGIANLVNAGLADQRWGVRVVIGGSTNDWFSPSFGGAAGGVAYLWSFNDGEDQPAFVFGADYGAFSKGIAEAVTHEVGHTLGLEHDGQTRFYLTTDDNTFHSVHVEYYPGHPAVYEEVLDDDGNLIGYNRLPNLDPTGWAPIMGVGYYEELTQWSIGEYPNSNNVEDDLALITSPQPGGYENGFGYRPDDHGDTPATADAIVFDRAEDETDTNTFSAEGIIGEHPAVGVSDTDYFSFTVDTLGEIYFFDISPFETSPNLDILAKIKDNSGNVLYTSNPRDELAAGGQTINVTNHDGNSDGGWVDGSGQRTSELIFAPGTYYLTVEGTGRPITYINPDISPGPIEDPPGATEDPQLVPDDSDWGYSNYGSLGYYSISGTRQRNLVVGVDFDVVGGMHPRNWNSYTGGSSPGTVTNLISEAGLSVPYELTVSTSGTTLTTMASAGNIPSNSVPKHGIALDKITGYLTTTTDVLSFEWSHLTPDTVYEVYVFGHASTAIQNQVTVVGGTWNGVQQVYGFTQNVSAGGLVVNGNAPGNNDLTTYSLLVVSTAQGTIDITVQGANGAAAGVAGLAIGATRVGTVSGQKFEDTNGDRIHQASEPGKEGWVIYLDLNNDGTINKTADRVISQNAPNVPQTLLDYATVKNDLIFPEADVISDVNVTLDISHTYDADLNLYLISPSGTRVKLFGDLGSAGDNFHNTTLDDEAANPLSGASAPFTGTFRPQNALSAFDGEVAAGKWTLEIQDDATGDTGVLNSWSLSITFAGRYLEPFQITDANGDYTFTNVRAGQYYIREYFLPEQISSGWRQSIAPAPITVRSGANVVGVEFGNWIPTAQHGSVQGVVFTDANANGAKDSGEAGLAGWTVYLDANGSGSYDVATPPVTFNSAGSPQSIQDFSVVNSPITVSGLGTVFSIEVTLDITHSFVGDLDAYLLSPNGRQVELFTAVGGQYNNLSNVTLSDSASRSIATLDVNDVPYTGTWRPEGLLSDFVGEDMAGTWVLQIRDTAFADEGTLNSWSIKITAGELSRVTDANGNYEFLDLPAGAQVVREVNQSGWNLINPNPTTIPSGSWANSQWSLAIAANGSITNANFGNQAAVALLGDYNRSNEVDAADYVLWRKKLGQTVSAPYDGPDGNGNGTVDAGDYAVWRSHFGQVHGTGAGAGALALAAGGSLEAPVSSPDLSMTNSTVVVPATTSPFVLADFAVESASPRASARPSYRPAISSVEAGDQALLAWLADAESGYSGISNDLDDDATPQSNAEPVDSAFESLEEMTLTTSGAV